MEVTWKGVYPAITTKFHEDGRLDLEALKENLKKQIEAGIHGIVVAGEDEIVRITTTYRKHGHQT